jgi:hypothetical protein
MNYRKHGLRLLGLLGLAVLGVMALAASAQAVAPGFLINKAPVGSLLATIGGEQEGRGSLVVPGLNLEINCEEFTVLKGGVHSNTDAEGELSYSKCSALEANSPLAEIKPCTVDEPIVAAGLILPAELTNGNPAVLAEKIKATILLLGAECTLPEVNVVKGEVCLAIDSNDTAKPLLLGSQAIQGECKQRPTLEALTEGAGVKDQLLYGKQEAFIKGSAVVFLTGAHEGENKTLGVSLY